MTFTMSRLVLTGTLALGALGATFGFTPGVPTAEAAPSVSPFAGSYVGADPAGHFSSSWHVTISDGGRITSSLLYSSGAKGSMSGQVNADGSYSMTVTFMSAGDSGGPRDPRIPKQTSRYDSAGTMAPDAAGNIVGTPTTGSSFVWLRQ